MPKVNVYVPDDLLTAVRAAELPVSAVCQEALEAELRRLEASTKASRGLRAVADRLLAGREAADRVAAEEGYLLGVRWAQESASLNELERIDRVVDRGWALQLHRVPSLITLFLEESPDADPDPDDWLDGESSIFDRGVIEGASTVYRQVQPLLGASTTPKRTSRG